MTLKIEKYYINYQYCKKMDSKALNGSPRGMPEMDPIKNLSKELVLLSVTVCPHYLLSCLCN